ncbi:hypothetical protein [Lysobacter fragariae]
MTDNERKGWHAHLPAILTASTAFLAALSTLYINVRSDIREADQKTKIEAATVAAAKVEPAAPVNQTMQLQLQRIEVVNDGSIGGTEWSFRVEADGRELFDTSATLDDAEDKKQFTPPAGTAEGSITLLPGQQALVKIIGEGGGMLSSAEATGTATLTAKGISGPIAVNTRDESGAKFIFHFVAKPVAAEQ